MNSLFIPFINIIFTIMCSLAFCIDDSNYILEENALVFRHKSKKPSPQYFNRISEELQTIKNIDNNSSLKQLYQESKVDISDLLTALHKEITLNNANNVREILNAITYAGNKEFRHIYNDIVKLLGLAVSEGISHIAKIMHLEYNIRPSQDDLNTIFLWCIDENLDLDFINKLLDNGAKFNQKSIIYGLGFAALEDRYADYSKILKLVIENTSRISKDKQGNNFYEKNLLKALSNKYGQTFETVIKGAITDRDETAIELLFHYGIYNDDLIYAAKNLGIYQN